MSSVNFKGNPITLKGQNVEVNDKAPVVKLKAKDLSSIEVGSSSKTQILLSMPSLDTAVCASEAREFNKKIASFPGAEVIIITLDLPFAMGRFCTTEGIDNVVVGSDFLAKEFGQKYGVLINDGPLEGLLARAVFVVKNGKIVYKELVSEVTNLPDLAKLEAFFKA
ncbi:MAG: thiol peroxidase [Helicobacter sp.]|uniref:thiol peroxidase n=1 Tax=Helicobacter sp. TaxID=218 RepID=UPI0025BBA8D8|nr:thiol peroxidase [Helicobacter sp.]MCH5313864.1 thiol peroxidase [Helicobacter sp.]